MNSNISLLIPPKSTQTNHSKMKLGKLPAVHDKRTLKLGSYLNDSAVLPTLPEAFIWNTNISQWGMMRNDEIGDCTVAAAGHLIMGWNNDLGIAVNSEANMDTNGIIGKIEKEAKTLWSQPVFKYGVIIGGVLIAATILYNLLLTPKDK